MKQIIFSIETVHAFQNTGYPDGVSGIFADGDRTREGRGRKENAPVGRFWVEGFASVQSKTISLCAAKAGLPRQRHPWHP